MNPFSMGARALPALLCLTFATLGSAAAYAQSDDSVQLVVDPTNSQGSYHAHEQLAGNDLPSDAVGTTHNVSGTIVLNPDGSVNADQSQILLDLTSLMSDEDQRDNFIKLNTLQVSQFPTATFVPTQIVGLGSPLPTSGQHTFRLMGNLTVHGVTQPVTWEVNAQFGETSISGDATTGIKITDFGMTIPSVAVLLSLNDALGLEFQFVANSY